MSCAVYKIKVKLARYISEATNSSIAEPLTELNNVILAVQPYLDDAELQRAETNGNQQLLEWISNVRQLSNDIESLVDIYCYLQSCNSESRFFPATATKTSPVIEFVLYGYSKITSFQNHVSFVEWRKFLTSFSKKVIELQLPEIIGKSRELHLAPNTIVRDLSSVNSKRKHIGVGKFDGLIGRVKDVKAIKDLITQRNSMKNVEIVAVEGKAGIGKTAVVKAVFNDVKGAFDCYAWVVFSHHTTTALSFLKDVISGLFDSLSLIGPINLDVIGHVNPLIETIWGCLARKKFLLVIDDISLDREISLNFLLDIFPSNSSGKILFTTRRMNVLEQYIDSVYKIERLNPQDSLELLHRSCNMDHKLWLDVQSIAEEITEICQYLPLSIKAIGGFLSTKTKASEWNDIRKRLSKSDLFPLCYAGMQPALRTCFLYSSQFADQVEFSTKTLQRMWIAEDLIEPETNLSLEETATLLMEDLIQRNFFQVVRVGSDGETKTCSILRPIRDFATQRCADDCFNPIVGERTITLSTSDICSLLSKFFISSIILYMCYKITSILSGKFLIGSGKEIDSFELRKTINGVGEFMGRAKEVIAVKCFTTQKKSDNYVKIKGVNLSEFNYNKNLPSLKTGFKSLAVMELRNLPIKSLPYVIGNLVLLKYLGLRGTKVKTLPKSIEKLTRLQTLDVRETMIVEMPKEVETLISLRHLLLSGSFSEKFVTLPFNIDSFPDMVTISGVKLMEEMATRLRFLSQVRKLSVGELRRENSEDLIESVYKMDYLVSLTIKCAVGEHFHIGETQNPPTSLQKLRLGGQVHGLHHWKWKLNSVKHLYLWDTQLEDDPFSILKYLKNIMVLSLCNVYDGESIEVEEGDFPELRKLSIICFDRLKEWGEIKNGALRNLEELNISNCSNLEAIPMGLENLSRLKRLHCTNMPTKFVHMANEMYGRKNKTFFKEIGDYSSQSAANDMNERTNTHSLSLFLPLL